MVAACGDGPPAGDSGTPWVTTADSTGDTIRLRIVGAVPERLVRTLIAEREIGQQDADEGGDESAVFGRIGDIVPSPDGGMLIFDSQAAEARYFDRDGRFLRRIGARGSGPGEHQQLNGITQLPNGDYVFWDAGNNRFNRYRADGAYVGTWRSEMMNWYTQNALHSDRDGFLHAWALMERGGEGVNAENRFGHVRMDTLGKVLDSLWYPDWGTKPTYLQAQSADGRSRTMSTLPFSPSQVHRPMPDGGLASAPGLPYVFYLLPRHGKPVRVEREFQPVAVSATEANERRGQIEQTMRRLNPSWSWTGPGVPSQKPPFRNLFTGADGTVWVHLSTPAEPIPAAELPPVREGVTPPPVRLTTREPDLFDVFAADGRLLGRVRPPPRTRLVRMQRTHAWGVRRDAMDVEHAVRFRVDPPFPD